MVYTPHTAEERRQMLKVIGVDTLEDLFADVPQRYRYPALDLPRPLSEMEVLDELETFSETNLNANRVPAFLGAGA